MLPTEHRLRSSSDFRATTRSRERATSGCLTVHVLAHSQGPSRVGLVISKAVGGSVVRHAVARRLRAVCADRVEQWPSLDVVIRALPSAAQADSARLAWDLDRAMSRWKGDS